MVIGDPQVVEVNCGPTRSIAFFFCFLFRGILCMIRESMSRVLCVVRPGLLRSVRRFLLVLFFGHFVLSIPVRGQPVATTTGWIEGRVTNGQGVPLAGIDLDMYELPSRSRTSHSAMTQADGTFVVGPLVPGSYVLRCDPERLSGYARTYYPTSYFFDSSQPIPVTAAQGTTANVV